MGSRPWAVITVVAPLALLTIGAVGMVPGAVQGAMSTDPPGLVQDIRALLASKLHDAGAGPGSVNGVGEASLAAEALPGPIDGIEPESHGYVAPIVDSNGNLYRVTESLLAEDNQPKMMKSTDGGATWTEMDAANRPGTASGSIGDLESGWLTWDASDKVATFTWQRSHAAYASFRTSDHPTQPDTWVSNTRENVDSATGSPQYMSHTSPTDQLYEWLFYNNSTTNPVYRSRSGPGSYGTQRSIDSSGGQPAATLDADNVSHIVYVKSSQLHYKTLTSAGTLSTASTRVDRNGISSQPIPHAAPMAYKIGGDTHVGVLFANPSGHLKFVPIINGTPGAEETVTTAPVMQNPGDTTNQGAVISLAVHGSTLHALWSDAATGNVVHASRPHGGSWSSPTVLVTVSGTEQAHYVYGRVYTYRGSTVLGYTYDLGPHGDDDSNIFYNELVLDGQPPGPVNQAPSVNAGPDQAVVLPASASLDGTVTDDGQPNPPGAVTTTWSPVSGPGTVTFADASAVDTTASFSTTGTYVLRLTADDGALTTMDEVTVTVTDSGGPVNQAPSVNAGADQAVVLPASASLDGTVTDDGLPNPPGAVTTAWSTVSGPGTVTFADASAVDTTASFSTTGTYVLRLTADDGALSAVDELTVTVTRVTEVRVSARSDDAEQAVGTGKTTLTSADLELTTDGSTQQVVGTRFAGLQVPRGATVTNAYVQFRVDEVSTGASSMTIRAEAADNTPTYQTTAGNITGRATTSASVAWSPPDWTTVGAAAAAQRTPDLSGLVQAVVGRAGWVQGNALALQFSGTGRRTAEAFEGGASFAPLLHVEYTTGTGGGPVNQAPVVNAGPDQSVALPASASLDGTVTDDGQPNPPGAVTTAWSRVSGPGTVTFGNASAVDTTASFSTAGTYVLQLTADDGALTTMDELTVTVTEGGGGGSQVLELRVTSGPDDAEQAVASGGPLLTSSDLELTTDGSTQQVVGTRFAGLQVPAGATITRAYVQFRTDEVSTGASSMTIRAEAADNTPTYQATIGNITGRATTSASVAWSPPDWTTVGEAATAQRTPDLSGLVQAVVGRAGWVQGNALALQFSGTGRRTSEAFEGGASFAPLLHVEYTTGTGGGPVNQAPVVNAGPDQSVVLPASASLDGTVTDDGLPNPPGAVTTTWSRASDR